MSSNTAPTEERVGSCRDDLGVFKDTSLKQIRVGLKRATGVILTPYPNCTDPRKRGQFAVVQQNDGVCLSSVTTGEIALIDPNMKFAQETLIFE